MSSIITGWSEKIEQLITSGDIITNIEGRVPYKLTDQCSIIILRSNTEVEKTKSRDWTDVGW